MFKGSLVALVTPMLDNGDIDFKALTNLLDWHVQSGTDAIVAVGTTGESATLSEDEQLQVIKHAVAKLNGKIPVIAGTGANATDKTIRLTEKAMQAGAHAALIVAPYYNKPTQEGLYQHYKAIAEALPIPIILYNVPSRTACDILPETVARLAHMPNIIGIKEATGNSDRCREILSFTRHQIHVYSGDDLSALDLMFAGAKGVISVTANIAPKLMSEMCKAALAQQYDAAQEYNLKLRSLHKAIALETNPIPAKWALHKMGFINQGIRLPLTVLSAPCQEKMLSVLKESGIEV